MDVDGYQPSCSFATEIFYDKSAFQEDGETVEKDPLDISNIIPPTAIKTEEIFIKEEKWTSDEDLGDELEDDIFQGSECEPSSIPDGPQRFAEGDEKNTRSKGAISSEKETSSSSKNRSEKIFIKSPREMSDVSDKSSNAHASGRFSKATEIRNHFNKFRNDFTSRRKPNVKFTQYGDDYHIFGQYIASSVRKLNHKRNRINIQWKICKMLHEAQISELK